MSYFDQQQQWQQKKTRTQNKNRILCDNVDNSHVIKMTYNFFVFGKTQTERERKKAERQTGVQVKWIMFNVDAVLVVSSAHINALTFYV